MRKVKYVKVVNTDTGKVFEKPEKIAYDVRLQKLGHYVPLDEVETAEEVIEKKEVEEEQETSELQEIRERYEKVVKKKAHANMKKETMLERIERVENQSK